MQYVRASVYLEMHRLRSQLCGGNSTHSERAYARAPQCHWLERRQRRQARNRRPGAEHGDTASYGAGPSICAIHGCEDHAGRELANPGTNGTSSRMTRNDSKPPCPLLWVTTTLASGSCPNAKSWPQEMHGGGSSRNEGA